MSVRVAPSESRTTPSADPMLPQSSLKGQAVELWREGHRYFVVADEADAQETMRRFGARRGGIWIPAELELVASIKDQAIRDDVAGFKRQLDGRLSSCAAGAARQNHRLDREARPERRLK